MGLMNADTFETATRSAAMGGNDLGDFLRRPGQRTAPCRGPPPTMPHGGARGAAIDHAFHLILADPQAPDYETDLAALIGQGHRSLKVFNHLQYRPRTTPGSSGRSASRGRPARSPPPPHLPPLPRTTRSSQRRARDFWPKAESAADRPRRLPPPRRRDRGRRPHVPPRPRKPRAPVIDSSTSSDRRKPVAEIAARPAADRAAPRLGRDLSPHLPLFRHEDVPGPPRVSEGGAKWMCSPPQRTPRRTRRALWAGLAPRRPAARLLPITRPIASTKRASFRPDPTRLSPPSPTACRGLEVRLPLNVLTRW